MTPQKIKGILRDLAKGRVSQEEAFLALRELPFEDLGFARLDNHRLLRNGIPEVIFCEGKSVPHITRVFERMVKKGGDVLATRVREGVFPAIQKICPNAIYHPLGRLVTFSSSKKSLSPKKGAQKNKKPQPVLLVSAGTSDLPVAEEARGTLEFLGIPVDFLYDVGVAGIHRLFHYRERLLSAKVIIVVAGMEGALASVVGGLLSQPVIAVPTSVGYGAHFQGLTPLLAMLSSCVPGLAVVNIDNGFGGAVLAYKILKVGKKEKDV